MRCTDRSPRSAGIPSAILALALAVVFVLGGARAAGIAPSSDEFALGDATTATAPKTAVDPITGDRLVVWLDEDDDRAAVVHTARVVYRLYGDIFRDLPLAA